MLGHPRTPRRDRREICAPGLAPVPSPRFLGTRRPPSRRHGGHPLRSILIVLAIAASALSLATPSTAGADPSPTAPFGTWSDAAIRLNEDVLGFTPDAARAAQLEGALADGLTLGQLVAQLRQDPDQLKVVDPATRLYRAFFLRVPDMRGLEYWIAQRRDGLTLTRMATQFAASSEFVNRYGNLSNRGFVELIYANVLQRPPDEAGVSYWTKQLDQGRRTRGSVMVGFSESNEYRVGQAPAVTAAVLRIALLHRTPTDDEFTADVTALAGGQTVADYAASLIALPEYATRIAKPRVLIVGDSIPYELLHDTTSAPPRPSLDVLDGSTNGCDGAADPPPARWRTGPSLQFSATCQAGWPTLYPPRLAIRPAVAALVVGPHAMLDHQFDGVWRHPCHAPSRTWYKSDITERLQYLQQQAGKVVLVLPAWPASNSVWIMPNDYVKRADCVRDVMQQAATATGTPVVDLGAKVCPSGADACDPLRTTDGVHIDDAHAGDVLGWLLDQAMAI